MKKQDIDYRINTKDQRGVALVWSLVTITVLLIITGSMANLIIKESQMSSGIDGSVKAYAAAESGLVHAVYLSNNNGNSPCQDDANICTIIADNQEYYFTIDNIDPTNPKIESTGKSGNVKRKIEKNITKGGAVNMTFLDYSKPEFDNNDWAGPAAPLNISREHDINKVLTGPTASNSDDPKIDIGTQSYSQFFKVKIIDNNNNNFSIGLSEASGNPNRILFEKTADNKAKLIYRENGEDKTKISNSTIFENGKEYIIRINYIKNNVVQLEVHEADQFGNLSTDSICKEKISVNLKESYDLYRVRFTAQANYKVEKENGLIVFESLIAAPNNNIAEVSYMGLKVN